MQAWQFIGMLVMCIMCYITFAYCTPIFVKDIKEDAKFFIECLKGNVNLDEEIDD